MTYKHNALDFIDLNFIDKYIYSIDQNGHLVSDYFISLILFAAIFILSMLLAVKLFGEDKPEDAVLIDGTTVTPSLINGMLIFAGISYLISHFNLYPYHTEAEIKQMLKEHPKRSDIIVPPKKPDRIVEYEKKHSIPIQKRSSYSLYQDIKNLPRNIKNSSFSYLEELDISKTKEEKEIIKHRKAAARAAFKKDAVEARAELERRVKASKDRFIWLVKADELKTGTDKIFKNEKKSKEYVKRFWKYLCPKGRKQCVKSRVLANKGVTKLFNVFSNVSYSQPNLSYSQAKSVWIWEHPDKSICDFVHAAAYNYLADRDSYYCVDKKNMYRAERELKKLARKNNCVKEYNRFFQ